jgi:hypothetical protein
MAGRGPWVQTSFPLRFSWLGSGLGALESIEAPSRSVATGFERTRTVINTVNSDLVDLLLPVFDEMPARV